MYIESMDKNRIVSVDGLWMEFEKAIKFGHYVKFKTRRGFDGWLKREIKKHPGRSMRFTFNDGRQVFRVELIVTPKLMLWASHLLYKS